MKELNVGTFVVIVGLGLFALAACETTKTDSQAIEVNNMLFKDSLGNTITESELANFTGTVDYEIMGGQSIDPAAKRLHEEARSLGQAGEYDASIAKLQEAIKMEPTWAYPPYDLAYTYLLKGDFENALLYYRKTNDLEPEGFFTAKTALYALEGEKSGAFPKGIYMTYMQIEWAESEAEKLEIAKLITENAPTFAPAWKELGVLLKDETERLDAIEQGLANHPDAETKGVLLINKAIILDGRGKKEEAKQILGNLIFSAETTSGNVATAKFAFRSLVENK